MTVKNWFGIRLKLLLFYWLILFAAIWAAGFWALGETGRTSWLHLVLFLLVSTAILSWGLSRLLIRPIREVSEAMEKFTTGFLHTRVHPSAPRDEIRELGKRFNRLAENFHQKVDELTKALAESQALWAGMEEGVLILDLKGRIQRMNEAMKIIASHLYPTDRGKHYLEVFREPGLSELIQRTLLSKESQLGTLALFGYPGKTFQVQTSLIRYPEKGGEGLVLVFHDVTDWKQLERSRQEFVANVSHELRTPLTAIKGYVEALLDGEIAGGSPEHKFLKIIERHAERMDKIVSDLLLLSEMEWKERALKKEAVSLSPLLQSALEIIRPMAEGKHQKLTLECEANLPSISADVQKLQQVMVNLLQNSSMYTPEGGTIRIRAREVLGGVEILVEDTGIGIPPEELPRIFERFYRVDKARSREEGGTGLGLSIVKQILEAHGGSIGVESQVGQGSRFTVFLPVK